MKQKLKVTKEMIRLRLELDPANKDWNDLPKEIKAKTRMPYNCEHARKFFGVAYKTFWRWQEPGEPLMPNKKSCPHCGVSDHIRVSKWINDGTLKGANK